MSKTKRLTLFKTGYLLENTQGDFVVHTFMFNGKAYGSNPNRLRKYGFSHWNWKAKEISWLAKFLGVTFGRYHVLNEEGRKRK